MPTPRSLVSASPALLASLLLAGSSAAITADPFAPDGGGGTLNGQSFTVGPGGEVYEVDGFLNVAGEDLNGGAFGSSAQLSIDALPTGLDYVFAAEISVDTTDITLSYTFTNNTGADLTDVTFISFLDVDIDDPINGFFNEIATEGGVLAAGQGFEADEPGFAFGDIYDNALLGTLDNTNIFPPPEDVSMALSYDFDLAAGESTTIDILISEDGDSLGTFYMVQSDPDSQVPTEITYSGEVRPAAGIPEPGSATLFGAGALIVAGALRRVSPGRRAHPSS